MLRNFILRSSALQGRRQIPIDRRAPPGASRNAEATESYIALLELEPIRRAIRPEDWPAQRRRVLSVVQHVVRGMIAETDSLAIHGEEACVITFAETTYEYAALSAARIGQRVVRSLFGERGLQRVALEPRVLPLKDLPLGDMGAGARDAPPSAGAPAPEDKRTRRQRIAGLFADDQSAEVYNSYVPIWSSRSKMADRFQLLPCRDNGPRMVLCGYAALGSAAADGRLIAFDLEAIERGLLALKRAIDTGLDGGLMLPLHFDTAGSNQGRAELLEIFPGLPSFVRDRLSFALSGVPDGVPEGRLHAVAGALRRLVKELLIVLEPSAGSDPGLRSMMARIRAAGVQGVAIALPSARADDGLEGACAVASRAASASLTVCALGLVSGRQAHRLSVAGCTSFGGPLFGGPFRDLPAPYSVHAKIFEQSD